MGGIVEGPQQEAWGRGVVEARGAAIGDRRWIWLREIGRVRKVLGAAVEDFCGDFRPRREEEIQAGEERIFWYAKQKEARSHTIGLARHVCRSRKKWRLVLYDYISCSFYLMLNLLALF